MAFFIQTFAITFASITSLYFATCNFIQLKIRFNEWILFVTFFSVISSKISFYYGLEMVLPFANLFMIMAFVFYKGRNFVNALMGTVLAFGITLSISNGLASMCVIFFDYDNGMVKDSIVTLLTPVIVYFLSKILGMLMHDFINSSWKDSEGNSFPSTVVILLHLALLFVFWVSFFSSIRSHNIKLLWLINALLMIIAIAFLVALIYAFFRIKSQNILLKNNQELIDNYEFSSRDIEDVLVEMQIQRHDTFNIFVSASLFISNNDFEGWKKYFEKEICPTYRDNVSLRHDMLKELKKIPSVSIRGLLQSKILKANGYKIKIHTEIDDKMGKAIITDIDIIRILGIILDNAIEECQKNFDMKIILTIFQKNNTMVIKVINDIYGKPPDINKVSFKGYSTKGKERGLGLYAIERMAGKYKGVLVRIYLSDDNDKFIVKLYIPTI
ncbi:MAG: GHKL domain-containing protein [Defluviitaleaceae bacterium]|nr:GHKL domain-containing protein [Defluviitaleaceae bacterium]